MTETVNEVPDPAAVLAVPTDEDIEVVRETLEEAYSEIEDEYVRIPEEPETLREERIMTTGSLYQELLAQLNSQ